MDPVSALGLAAAIVQLLDFAGKVTNGARQIYISGADAPAVDADVGTCALELDALCNRLKTSHLVPQTPDDKALCRLASRCSAISKELSDFLKSIKAKNPDKRWQCFLSSVKSQLRKSQRDDLLTRLSECRAQLTIQLSRLISLEQKTLQQQLGRSIQQSDDGFREVLDAIKRLQGNVSVSNFDARAELQLRRLFDLPDATRRTITAGRVLKLLEFEDMHERLDDIVAAHHDTFAWTFDGYLLTRTTSGSADSTSASSKSLSLALNGMHAAAGADQRGTASRAGRQSDPQQSTVQQQSPMRPPQSSFRSLEHWLRSGSGICHIVGDAGAGKSTFLKFLYHHHRTSQLLQQWADQAPLVSVKAFLWRNGSKRQRSIAGLCRTLMWEILQQRPELTQGAFPEVWDLIEATPWQVEPRLHISVERIEEALQQVFQTSVSTDICRYCIFIDGIDEQGDENNDLDIMVQLLSNWSVSADTNIKLCITSRPYSTFSRFPDHVLRFRIEDYTRDDLTKVLTHQLSSWQQPSTQQALPPLRLDSPCPHVHGTDLIDFIVSRANGNFRWALSAGKIAKQMFLQQSEGPVQTDQSNRNFTNPVYVNQKLLDSSLRVLQAPPHRPQQNTPPDANADARLPTIEDPDVRRAQIKDLTAAFGLSDSPEEDLFAAEDELVEGTCEWIKKKPGYTKMQDSHIKSPKVLWITGHPGSGKSTMAAYLVNQLQATNANVSFFFFKHSDRSKAAFSSCLKALALQMAHQSASVRQRLHAVHKDLASLSNGAESERMIWRKLFLDTVFQHSVDTHYWVIDGLDECSNPMSAFTTIFGKLDKPLPTRIFVLSRETSLLKSEFARLTTSYQLEKECVTPIDTQDDIKLVAEAKAKALPVTSQVSHDTLIKKVLSNSNGNFLWTVLVLQELSQAYTSSAAKRVLEEVPGGMHALYSRALETMSQTAHGKPLAQAILSWTACGAQTLTTVELNDALALDFGETVQQVDAGVTSLCGHLVVVDRNDHVRLIHETAREFLTDESLDSEFAVRASQAHMRIARTCLAYLTGSEMKAPRSLGRSQSHRPKRKRSRFSGYACRHFSYHLRRADPRSSDLLSLLNDFLGGNVLSWIEVVAAGPSLFPMIQAAEDINSYTQSCLQHCPSLVAQVQLAKRWSTDLVRIAARFADALATCPAAIFSLVPPFCPNMSAIRKTARTRQGLRVTGYHDTDWDDRLSSFDVGSPAYSLACGKDFFAVGVFDQAIHIYHSLTGQKYKTLQHKGHATALCFLAGTDYLASCSSTTLRIWDLLTGQDIHHVEAPRSCLDLAYADGCLSATCSDNYMARWQLGPKMMRLANIDWRCHLSEGFDLIPPTTCISTTHNMLAVATPSNPILLWDLEEDAYYGSCGEELPNGAISGHGWDHWVSSLVFNPDSTAPLLAAAYRGGDLALLHLFDTSDVQVIHANCWNITCSHDGRFLAGTGTVETAINVFDFKTLRHIWRVQSPELNIRQLAFDHNDESLVAIHGFDCSVWSSAVFQQASRSDESNEDTAEPLPVVSAANPATAGKIVALDPQPLRTLVLCGDTDGSVFLFNVEIGQRSNSLCSHGSAVRLVRWWHALGAFVSLDSSCIEVRKVEQVDQRIQPGEQLFQAGLDVNPTVTLNLLTGDVSGKLILYSPKTDYFWSVKDESQRSCKDRGDSGYGRTWLQHPGSPMYAICTTRTSVEIYAWADWSQVSCINMSFGVNVTLTSSTLCAFGDRHSICLELYDRNYGTRAMRLLDNDTLMLSVLPGATKDQASGTVGHDQQNQSLSAGSKALGDRHLAAISTYVERIIGFTGAGTMVFLDNHSWVCSVAVEQTLKGQVQYRRHFFIPSEWFTSPLATICALSGRDVLIARNDSLVCVKGGLDYSEELTIPLSNAH